MDQTWAILTGDVEFLSIKRKVWNSLAADLSGAQRRFGWREAHTAVFTAIRRFAPGDRDLLQGRDSGSAYLLQPSVYACSQHLECGLTESGKRSMFWRFDFFKRIYFRLRMRDCRLISGTCIRSRAPAWNRSLSALSPPRSRPHSSSNRPT